MEVYFAEMRFKGKLSDELINKIRNLIEPYKKINLVAAVQFIDQMNQVKDSIKDKEFVLIKSKYRAFYPGQLLGCDTYVNARETYNKCEPGNW